MRRTSVMTFLAIMAIIFPLSAVAGEFFARNLPDPIVVIANIPSPARFLEEANRTITATVKDTPKTSSYEQGKKALAAFRFPSVFDNPNARVMVLIAKKDITERYMPPLELAVAIAGVDRQQLEKELDAAGLRTTVVGGVTEVNCKNLIRGNKVYLASFGGDRLMATMYRESVEKFARLLGRWRPEESEDIADAILDLARLREVFADGLNEALAELDPKSRDKLINAIPINNRRGTEAVAGKLRANLADAILRVAGMLKPLVLGADIVDARIRSDDEKLRATLRVHMNPRGQMADFLERYTEQETPADQFGMARAVADDAFLMTFFSGGGGTLFADGGLLASLAVAAGEYLLPNRADDVAALGREFAATVPEESVTGYYLRDNGIFGVNYVSVKDGRQYVDTVLRTRDLANAFLDRLNALTDAPGLHLALIDGKSAGIAYKRVHPVLTPGTGQELGLAGACSLYLTATSGIAVSLFGVVANPDVLRGEIFRLSTSAEGILLRTNVNAMRMHSELMKYRRNKIGIALFRPGYFFTRLGSLVKILPAAALPPNLLALKNAADNMRDSGGVAGLSISADDGACLAFDLLLQYGALNDLMANINILNNPGRADVKAPSAKKAEQAGGDVEGWDIWGDDAKKPVPPAKTEPAAESSDTAGIWQATGINSNTGQDFSFSIELDDKGGGFVSIPDILTRPRVKVLKRSGDKLAIEADLFAGGTRRLLALDGVLKGGAWTGDYSITRDNADEPDAIGTFAATHAGPAPQPQISGKTVTEAKTPEKPDAVPGDIAGSWEGTYTAFGQDYRLGFVFDGTPPCDFKGSVDMPDEKIRAEIVEACGAGGMATPSATVRAAWKFPGGGGKQSVMQVTFAGTILDGVFSGDFIVAKEGSEKALSNGTFTVKRSGGE